MSSDSKTFSLPVPVLPSNVLIHWDRQYESHVRIVRYAETSGIDWSERMYFTYYRLEQSQGHSTYTNISHGSLNTLDMKLIFQTNWQTMQRTNWLSILKIILVQFLRISNSCFKEDLVKAIDLVTQINPYGLYVFGISRSTI